MKQQWQKLALKIDALSLRERVIMFAAAALVLIVLINTLLLEPQYARQKQLSQRIRQEQAQAAAWQAEIQHKAEAQSTDPDADVRSRLEHMQREAAQMRSALQTLGNGLVSPDRMSALLEDILKRNGKLRLATLKTLPASPLGGPVEREEKSIGQASNAAVVGAGGTRYAPTDVEIVYRHGVEITVQGTYLDLLDYLAQLEAMPWQLFWGRATLEVREYPKAILTLRVHTLSLDKTWLNI